MLSKTSFLKNDMTWPLLTGLGIIFFSLFPYWSLGPNQSVLGWYDEFDIFLLWNYTKALSENILAFFHHYSGGTDGGGWFSGNEYVSLYRFLFHHMDLYLVGILVRLLNLFLLFSGTYIFARKVLKEPSNFLCFSLALFATFANDIPYGFTLGGAGLDMSVSIWFAILAWRLKDHLLALLTSSIGLTLIASTMTMPVYVIPTTGFFLTFLVLMNPDGQKLPSRQLLNLGLAFSAFVVLFNLNWIRAYNVSILAVKDYSSRMMGVLTGQQDVPAFSLEAFSNILQSNWNIYNIVICRPPGMALFWGFLLFTIHTVVTRRWRPFFAFCLLFFLVPVISELFFKTLDVPVLGSFRWTHLLTMTSLMLALGFVTIRNPPLRHWKNMMAVGLLSLAGWSAYKLLWLTIINFDANYGLASVKSSSVLEQLKANNNINNFRTVSAGMIGSLPIYHGIPTFDGSLHHSPIRRNYFIAYGVYSPSRDKLHTHRHFFYDFPKDLDLDSLQMVNVRFVVSDTSLDLEGLQLVNSSSPVFIESDHPFGFLFDPFKENLRLAPGIHLYRMESSWDRVFAAKSVRISDHSWKSKQFYGEMKELNRHEILISSDDATSTPNLEKSNIHIVSWNLTESGAEIRTEGTGVLVYNQVYTHHWKAFCGDRELTVVPANGVMMALLLESPCASLNFKHLYILGGE